MAEYAHFHEFRRYMNQSELNGLFGDITLHKNKEQLSKWLQSQMHKKVASDSASMHGLAFCSFEQSSKCPIGYLSGEVSKCAAVAISRTISHLLIHKESNPEAYGDAFEYEYINAYGKYSYDSDTVTLADNEILIALNSDASDDFFDAFDRKLVAKHHQHSSFMAILPVDAVAIGVASLAKSSSMIQIHVGIAIKNKSQVRIIINEAKSSQFDKMMAMNNVFDKVGLNEQKI